MTSGATLKSRRESNASPWSSSNMHGSNASSFASISRGGGGSRTPSRRIVLPNGRSKGGERSNFSSPSIVSVLGSSSAKRNASSGYDKTVKRRQELPSGPNFLSESKKSHSGGSTNRRSHENNDSVFSPQRSTDLLSTPTRTKVSLSGGNYPEMTCRTSVPPSPPSLMRTHSNILGSSRSFNINERTPETKKTNVTPSCSSNRDRFIPNRSQMRVDLCRASILSADQRRIAAIEKKVIERSAGENGDPNNSPRSPQNPAETASSSTTGMLTPLQSEFRARMRGALLSVPIDDVGSKTPNRSSSSRLITGTGGETTTPAQTINGTVTPTLSSREYANNLAYSNLNSSNDGSGRRFDSSQASDPSHEVVSRVLSFRNNSAREDSLPSSLSGGGNGTPPLSSSMLNRNNGRPKGVSRVVSPHPYIHDQLHVLHRSAADSAGSISDPSSFSDVALRSAVNKITRRINAAPSRILDAPELVDDYYLNLISWGKDNVLAVALGQCVYLWNAATGDIKHLLTLPGSEDFVTSVQWADAACSTSYIAVGTNDGPVQLWDAQAVKKVRTLDGHTARVGSLSWNQHWLSSGGRDSVIIQHDHRSSNHIVSTYAGHTQEVCGLKWNEDGTTLASGGNENYLCLWDAAISRRSSNERGGTTGRNRESPRLTLTQHQAAVKALAWCPFHRGLLASGGGTADRTIKFWNSNSGALLNSVDTGSQVCSLLWSKHQHELCSSHGFSENQLILWRYPRMTKIQEFKGHTARVLHMDQSPDGACVVSAAADETLRFWDVFGSPPNKKNDTLAMGRFPGQASLIR